MHILANIAIGIVAVVTAAKREVVGTFAAAEQIGFALLHSEGSRLAGGAFMASVAEEAVLASAAHTKVVGLAGNELDTFGLIEKDDCIFTHENSFVVVCLVYNNFLSAWNSR